MDIEAQITWFAKNNPSHLTGYFSSDCPELGLGEGGHGEEIAIGHRLKCKCGQQEFGVTAFALNGNTNNHEMVISPVHAICPTCELKILVFDSNLHGYEPIACGFSSLMHGREEDSAQSSIVVPVSSPVTVDLVHYYPDDLFEEEFDEYEDRRGDLFTWLVIVFDQNKEPNYPALEFECA